MPAPTRTQHILVSSQTLAFGTTLRARVDLASESGGEFWARITIAGTALVAPVLCRWLISHAGTMPAAAAEGTADGDWKMRQGPTGSGIAANTSVRIPFSAGPGTRSVMVEFQHTAGSGASATIEAHGTTWVF